MSERDREFGRDLISLEIKGMLMIVNTFEGVWLGGDRRRNNDSTKEKLEPESLPSHDERYTILRSVCTEGYALDICLMIQIYSYGVISFVGI